MSYREHVTQDLRLVILRLLAEDTDYESNSSIIQIAVEEYGHRCSRDQLHTELSWMAEQGLMQVAQVANVQIVTLTPRGLDVADGRAICPGVKKPGPR